MDMLKNHNDGFIAIIVLAEAAFFFFCIIWMKRFAPPLLQVDGETTSQREENGKE